MSHPRWADVTRPTPPPPGGSAAVTMPAAGAIVVVLRNSDGLPQELESLRDLDLFDRLCVVVPPVGAAQVADRLGTLAADAVYARMWGGVGSERDLSDEGLALVSLRGVRSVLVAGRHHRSATDYLGVAREVTTVLRTGAAGQPA